TSVGGRLIATGARIASSLTLRDAKLNGQATADFSSIGRVEIDHSEFEPALSLQYARVETQVLIKNKSRFSRGLFARFIRALDFRIESSIFGGSIWLQNAQIGSFALTGAETINQNCANCDLAASNATINTFEFVSSHTFRILAGKGRFKTFEARSGVVPTLD